MRVRRGEKAEPETRQQGAGGHPPTLDTALFHASDYELTRMGTIVPPEKNPGFLGPVYMERLQFFNEQYVVGVRFSASRQGVLWLLGFSTRAELQRVTRLAGYDEEKASATVDQILERAKDNEWRALGWLFELDAVYVRARVGNQWETASWKWRLQETRSSEEESFWNDPLDREKTKMRSLHRNWEGSDPPGRGETAFHAAEHLGGLVQTMEQAKELAEAVFMGIGDEWAEYVRAGRRRLKTQKRDGTLPICRYC